MAMFGGGKNDINIPINFTDWKKSLEELKSTVKNTSLTVSLNVDNKVYNTIQTKLSNVLEKEYTLNLNYKPVVASISTALQDVLKDVSTSFSNITVSLNLNGQKEALQSKLKDLPIEIKLEYEKALKELEKRVTDHKATLKISEFVAETDGLDKVATSMQEWFNDPANSVTLFNNKTRIDKTVLVKYLKRLVLEINKAMTTDEALKIAFSPDTASLMKKVDEEIPELEAAITVPIELDKSKLDTISEDIANLLDSVTAKLADVSFDKFIDDVHSVVTEYASTIGSMSQATKTAVDECIANIERIGKMDSIKLPEIDSAVKDTLEALVNVTNNENLSADSDLVKFFDSLGQAISDFNDRKLDTTIINDFANAITSLNTSMGSVATVADTMMKGAFGKLLDAVNGVDTSRLRALTAELSKFARSLSASETFGNLIEAINKVKDAVNDLPNTFDTVFNELRSALSDIQTEIRNSIGGISIPAPTVNVSAPASSGTVTIDSADCIVNAINRVARHIVVSRTVNTSTITTGVSDLVSAISGISVTVTTPSPSPSPSPSPTHSPSPSPSPRNKSGGEESDGAGVTAITTAADVIHSKLEKISDFFRKLNQTGIGIPRFISNVVGWGTGVAKFASVVLGTAQKGARAFESGFLTVLSKHALGAKKVLSELEDSLQAVGFETDAVVKDTEGNEQSLVEVWRKCTAEAYAYRDALRAKGIKGEELKDKTNQYAAKLLRERTTGNFHVESTKTGQTLDVADIKKFTGLLGSNAKDFVPKIFSSVLGKFSGMAFQVFSKLITRLISFAMTGWGLAITGLLTLAFTWWRAGVNRQHEINKRQAQTQLAWTKQQGELGVQYAKQRAQLEQKAIQAASELRKKQSEQQMALYEKGMSAYSFEVDSQERIYKLELLRLQAVKENEQIQQRIENINENVSKTYEHRKQQMESRMDIKFTNDITNLYGLKKDQGILGNGEQMSDELRNYFSGLGQSISSWFTGGLDSKEWNEIAQNSMKNMYGELAEMTASDFETIKTSNKAFIDEVTALQATTTGKTKEALDGIIRQYDQWQKSMNTKRVDSVTGQEYTIAGRAEYVKLMRQNAREYVNTHWNGNGISTVDEYGNLSAITSKSGSREEVIAAFEQKQREAQRYMQEVDNWYAQGNIALNEQYKLIRDRAVKEQQINEQMKKAIEAQINLQTELKKKLTDRLVGLWDSFGDWRTTNQSKIQASRMSQLDALHQVQLADPRLLRNQDAKIALQVQQAQEKYMMKNRGELEVAHDEERFNLEQEQRKALWDLEKQHEMAKHKIEMDNITKISNAQSNNIKLQRELIKRFMDHAVTQFKIYNDPYGRNRYDTQKELATIQIEKKFDTILTNMKKRDNIANTRWEMRKEQKIQDDVMKEQSKQLAIQQAAEEEWLKKKQDLEIKLLEMEFKMRMKQIKAEIEYKHALEEAQKKMENAGTEEMLGGKEITVDELRAIGKDISADASPEEIKRVISYLTQEEKNQIAVGRMKEMDIRFKDIEKALEKKGIDVEGEKKKKAEEIKGRTDDEAIVEGMGVKVKELKEAILAVEENREKATIDQQQLYDNFMRRNVVLPMAKQIQNNSDEETKKRVEQIEKDRQAALDNAKREYEEKQKNAPKSETTTGGGTQGGTQGGGEKNAATQALEFWKAGRSVLKNTATNTYGLNDKGDSQEWYKLRESLKKQGVDAKTIAHLTTLGAKSNATDLSEAERAQATQELTDALVKLGAVISDNTTAVEGATETTTTETGGEGQKTAGMKPVLTQYGLENSFSLLLDDEDLARRDAFVKDLVKTNGSFFQVGGLYGTANEDRQKELADFYGKSGIDFGELNDFLQAASTAKIKNIASDGTYITKPGGKLEDSIRKLVENRFEEGTDEYNQYYSDVYTELEHLADDYRTALETGDKNKSQEAIARIYGLLSDSNTSYITETDKKPQQQAPQESWEDIQARINKQYDTMEEEERRKGQAFDADLDQLANLGEAETAAILQQTDVANKNAEIEHRLLEELIKNSTPDEEFKDIKKELAKLETDRQIGMDRLKLTADKSIQRIETQGKADLELQKTAREDAQEGRYAQIEQQKQIASAVKETHFENMKRQDQLNADVVKRNQEYRQSQRSNQTDFAISMMQAKSGTDRLKAISKYRSESEYNAQSAAMDIRHRNEMEELEKRGNYTQEEKAQLEARQQDEKSSLDESKKYADAVRDAMGDVGGIRSLVSEGTGQTSDLVGTWERIQAAAFGHIEDPAADAVINMDRAQALQHASLMSLLTQQLPVIAQGINSMNYKNIVNNYNNATQGTPPTVGGWS